MRCLIQIIIIKYIYYIISMKKVYVNAYNMYINNWCFFFSNCFLRFSLVDYQCTFLKQNMLYWDVNYYRKISHYLFNSLKLFIVNVYGWTNVLHYRLNLWLLVNSPPNSRTIQIRNNHASCASRDFSPRVLWWTKNIARMPHTTCDRSLLFPDFQRIHDNRLYVRCARFGNKSNSRHADPFLKYVFTGRSPDTATRTKYRYVVGKRRVNLLL